MVKADRASTEQCGLSGWLKPHFAFAAAELAAPPSVVAFWFSNRADDTPLAHAANPSRLCG